MTAASTRDRILVSARKLFAKKGFHETALADLRREADVQGGSLHHAFPKKEDLLLAVLREYSGNFDSWLIEPAWEGLSDPRERILALLSRYRELLLETEFEFSCPIGSLALELRSPPPAVRDALETNFHLWMLRTAQCFDAIPDTSGKGTPKDLALITLTTMEGAVMLARTFRDIAYFDRAVGTLAGLLFDGAELPAKEKSPTDKALPRNLRSPRRSADR